MRNDRENIIVEKTLEFSLLIMDFSELLESKKKYVLARQILKSGTSIGANVREAQNAESKTDFIHKMKIAAKEAEETQYWLTLCEYAQSYPDCKELTMKLEEIHRVLGKILSTAKRKYPFNYLWTHLIIS